MAKKVKIIQKKDEYSMEYNIGDVLDVDSTWYGGVTVLGKTGVPVPIDRDEYEDISDEENTDQMSEDAQGNWAHDDIQAEKACQQRSLHT